MEVIYAMNTMISLKDLGMIVLWGSLVIMLIYLALLFKRLNDTVKGVNKLIEENSEDIGQTIKEVPKITKNISSITTEAVSSVQAVKGIAKNVGILKKAAAPIMKSSKKRKKPDEKKKKE
jgi:uncharacterized protein YoxC